jgi:hypothetical protein
MCFRSEDIKFWPWRLETFIFTNGKKFGFIRNTQTNSFSQKKRTTKKKVVIFTMKEEDEEGEKAEKVGKNWVDGEVLHLIAL